MTVYRLTHPETGAQATRTSDRTYTHGIIIGNGMRSSFAASADLAHKALNEYRRHPDAAVVRVEILEKLPKKPADPDAAARKITVTYTSIDGVRNRRSFVTLRGAQTFAQDYVGRHPEIGSGYAASGDGVGQVYVTGCSLAQLFPPTAAQADDEIEDMPPPSDPRWSDSTSLEGKDWTQEWFDAAVAAHPEGAQALAEAIVDGAKVEGAEVAPIAAPTTETYAALQQAFDHFNAALFAPQLPPCLITLQRKEHRVAGYYWAERFVNADGEKVDEIAMNPQHFGQDTKVILSTLVHEMTHLWQAHHGKPGRKGYHNEEWAQKMDEVGLTPMAADGSGKRTGQKLDHRIVPGGRFDLAADALLADSAFGLRWREVQNVVGAKEKKKATRAKYCCPDCGLRMWGKPAAKLICGECEVVMPEEGAEGEGEDC